MIGWEVVGGVILFGLVLVVTWMAIVGSMGVLGIIRLKRCPACGHFLTRPPAYHPLVCPYCRHPWLVAHVMPVRIRHFLPGEMGPRQGRADTGPLSGANGL